MRLARLAAVVALASLSACLWHRPAAPAGGAQSAGNNAGKPQDRRYAQANDSGPGGPLPDVSKIPEPVPRAEPKSVYGNKSPYQVLGRSYTVLPQAQGYVERGIASWYGNKFHGYTTSNFEKYDMYAYTAAHKTLPLPSYARVTNLENGKSVVVRVNDRGPFAENRIIDLSYVAAVKLGIWQKGTGLVEVRAIDPAHPAAPPPPPPAAPAVAGNAPAGAAPPAPLASGRKPAIYLQVGAFGDRANADRAADTLRGAKLGEVRVVAGVRDGKSVQRVRLGPLKDVSEVDALSPKVRALGLGEPRVAIDD